MQELQVLEIEFVGEQDGPPERLLKERLSELFVVDRQLERAYLARVRYAGESGVALCLRNADEQNPKLAEAVGAIFGSIFGVHEHLDIVFVSEGQESGLRSVCRPFYSTAR